MSAITESDLQTSYRRTIDECIEYARCNGVGDFRLGKRSHPRLPYVHPIRYCLESSASETQSLPGYTLNISEAGMALCCREALSLGISIRVRLPLSDGSTVWMEGTIAYCEPDAEHYQAGIAFVAHDDHNDDCDSELS